MRARLAAELVTPTVCQARVVRKEESAFQALEFETIARAMSRAWFTAADESARPELETASRSLPPCSS